MKINIEKTLQLFSSTFGLGASFFFIKGAFSLTNNDIADWSSRWYDVNEHLIQSFVSQKIDFLFGAIFLLFSFIIGLLSLLLGKEYLKKKIFKKWTALFLSLGILILLLAASYPAHKSLVKHQENKVMGHLGQTKTK